MSFGAVFFLLFFATRSLYVPHHHFVTTIHFLSRYSFYFVSHFPSMNLNIVYFLSLSFFLMCVCLPFADADLFLV